MELIYLYIDGYRNFQKAEFNFCADLSVYYNGDGHSVTIDKVESGLPENFWGDTIRNVTMLIGNNGAGKTSVFHFLIQLLYEMWEIGKPAAGKGLFIFREGENLYWYSDQEMRSVQGIPEIVSKNGKLKTVHISRENIARVMGKTKFIYMTGALSRSDYEREKENYHNRYNILYDCSVGNLIYQDTKLDVNKTESEIENYFVYEQYKQIKYVFDKRQQEIIRQMAKEGFRVPVPTVLHIQMNRRIDGENIVGEKGISEFVRFNRENTLIKKVEDIFINTCEDYRKKEKGTSLKSYESEFLCYCLKKEAVQCACRSIVRMLKSETDVYKHSLLYDTDEQKLSEARSYTENFRDVLKYIWQRTEEVLDIWGGNSSFGQTLKGYKEYYLDFFDFIDRPNLEQHFTLEQTLSGNPREDLKNKTLCFYVSTSDIEWFTEFVKKYRYICNPDYFLDFQWGLSSGEYNLLSMFSSLYYIYDADYTNEKNGEYTIWNVSPAGENKDYQKKKCDSVILLLDEADLSYHPEWQREYISILTAFLPRIYPKVCCRNIQIVLSTHSPLLLGDMPEQNILYLRVDYETGKVHVVKREQGTFGQNIHLLLRDSFFLERGTVGEFAQKKINSLFNKLTDIEIKLNKSESFTREEQQEQNEKYRSLLKGEYRKETALIAEPIIRNKLSGKIEQLLYRLETKGTFGKDENRYRYMSDTEITREIAQLQQEIDRRKR